MTLKSKLKDLILREGSLSLERYMDICLADPDHGYYRTRDPLGRGGDFVTASEISQIFGELMGLWAAATWDMMGRPDEIHLVEIGPGRGTLMADALRAAKVLPAFRQAIRLHLVETSPTLRAAQKAALSPGGLEPIWHDQLADLPKEPVIILANEFFDALPIRQYVSGAEGWRERHVVLKSGSLAYGKGLAPAQAGIPLPQATADETVVEELAQGAAETRGLATHIARHGGAALIIDYGYWGPATGDTFQAVQNHRYADPLQSPGEADLTAHVDFHQLAQSAVSAGATVHGPLTQRELLLRLGAEPRAGKLKQSARPDQKEQVEIGFRRITATGNRAMGDLFKAIAITAPGLAPPPAFAAEERFQP